MAYRAGDKVKFDYPGKPEPVELKQRIEKRRWILKQLKKIEIALYALGAAKRSQSLGQAKRFEVLELDNLITACADCNAGKSASLMKQLI